LTFYTPSIMPIMGSFIDLRSQYPPTMKNNVADNHITLMLSSVPKSLESFPAKSFTEFAAYSKVVDDSVFIFSHLSVGK